MRFHFHEPPLSGVAICKVSKLLYAEGGHVVTNHHLQLIESAPGGEKRKVDSIRLIELHPINQLMTLFTMAKVTVDK